MFTCLTFNLRAFLQTGPIFSLSDNTTSDLDNLLPRLRYRYVEVNVNVEEISVKTSYCEKIFVLIETVIQL